MTQPTPPPVDPGLSTTMAQYAAVVAAEEGVRSAALASIEEFLRLARVGVLGEPGAFPALAGWPTVEDWVRIITRLLLPAVDDVWENRFTSGALGGVDDDAARAAYMATVASRLRSFPDEAFEDIRSELLAGQEQGESIPQLRDRIGRALRLDALTRAAEEQIAVWRRELETATGAEAERLRTQIRDMVTTRDESNRRWWWRAERIARTETIGAYNAAAYTSAATSMAVSGDRVWNQWIATVPNARTRPTHVAAHLQIRDPGDAFQVGDSQLRFPGDPTGAAGEVINCRCVLVVVDAEDITRRRRESDEYRANLST